MLNDLDHRADRLGLFIKWKSFNDFIDPDNKDVNPTNEYCIYLKQCATFIFNLEQQYNSIFNKKMIDFTNGII